MTNWPPWACPAPCSTLLPSCGPWFCGCSHYGCWGCCLLWGGGSWCASSLTPGIRSCIITVPSTTGHSWQHVATVGNTWLHVATAVNSSQTMAICQQSATGGNSWQHVATVGNIWQQLATPGNMLQQLATVLSPWQCVSNRWQQMATNGNSWQHVATIANTWQQLETCEKS